MALINCPECGKEVSDRAKQCIHCGCPLTEEIVSNESLYKVVLASVVKNTNEMVVTTKLIKEITNKSIGECSRMVSFAVMEPQVVVTNVDYSKAVQIKNILSINSNVVEIVDVDAPIVQDSKLNELQAVSNRINNQNVPRCPTCQSTDIKKISFTNKAVHVGAFGLLGMGKVTKTFRCKNCKYEW